MIRTPNPNQRRLRQRARTLLTRIEHIDTSGDFEFENTRQRELAYIQLMIDLLAGAYLSIKGKRYLEERLRWSHDWVDDIDDWADGIKANNAEETL